ncbi:hypothetical protein MSUIS_05680 [Mycoplasma suis KI3806]|uniref:Uncharacterized protein n=1 Tax=Mycoplasma suis (strain KI_3806) TaxID=708248 RepID=F0V1Y0_MYCS3|nr:hypothetical protein [Mycoplasma suis]CBZ40661.1 hypothetical protein MSUIS_05680 [Mycoplasma suis KI3806]
MAFWLKGLLYGSLLVGVGTAATGGYVFKESIISAIKKLGGEEDDFSPSRVGKRFVACEENSWGL